ncbi:speckle-type poz protein [Anaeramoeba flamelloides]|uniref:Speckle-type poz protein n=1 Tax=Anaeramoeba flamelloides TaxID=1746091 RepID=A0ABQ8XEE4_9EUKA|nr:speckle-type poz protein [Anaeramoeba flamelloides]
MNKKRNYKQKIVFESNKTKVLQNRIRLEEEQEELVKIISLEYENERKRKRIKIVSSHETYLILTESGKACSLADKNPLSSVVPLLDADQSTFEKIRPVTLIEEKKLFVNSVAMGIGSGYYLCNGDQLYSSGSNDEGRLGIGLNGGKLTNACLFPRQGEESCPIVNRTQPNLGFNRPKWIVWLGVLTKSCNQHINSTTAITSKNPYSDKNQPSWFFYQLFGIKRPDPDCLWVIYLEKLEQTFNLLELSFPPSVGNTLEKDIAQLYKENDSKDFKILVKIDDKEENKEEEDEEENYEEIRVQKFILLARSGFFRDMFDNVNEKENTNKIQDYTNKSIESLKILIKYLYTNSIEMTTNQDPELIVDELSDAVEFYQLNDQCNFESELYEN